MSKVYWRISPALTCGKNAWQVERVTEGAESKINSGFGFYSSLKRAKSVVAHLKRKPIEVK